MTKASSYTIVTPPDGGHATIIPHNTEAAGYIGQPWLDKRQVLILDSNAHAAEHIGEPALDRRKVILQSEGQGISGILNAVGAGGLSTIHLDIAERWKSIAMGVLQGDKTRPHQNEFQILANSLPSLGGGWGNQNIGIDGTQYPIDGFSLGDTIEDVRGAIAGFASDAVSWATDTLGNALAGGAEMGDPAKEQRRRDRENWEKVAKEEGVPSNATAVKIAKKGRINQILDKVGFLRVVYPSTKIGETGLTMQFPFFENPIISEKRKAKYSSIPIFNRNEPLRLFTGAEARNLDVTFTYTIPHIHEMGFDFFKPLDTDKYSQFKIKLQEILRENNQSLESLNERFKTELEPSSPINGDDPQLEGTEAGKEFGTQESLRNTTKTSGMFQEWRDLNLTRRPDDSDFIFQNKEFGASYLNTLNLFSYVVNAVRTFVVGSTHSPSVGPPLVHLNFGYLYRDVPCICTDYSFTVEGSQGYDNFSLMPRQLKIKISLEEYRQAGGIGAEAYDFEENPYGLPGWLDFTEQGTLDPIYTEEAF